MFTQSYHGFLRRNWWDIEAREPLLKNVSEEEELFVSAKDLEGALVILASHSIHMKVLTFGFVGV